MGSTNDGKCCRMLKIDRMHNPSSGLLIEEDEKDYQPSEVSTSFANIYIYIYIVIMHHKAAIYKER